MRHPACHYSVLLLLIAVYAVVGSSDRERTPDLVLNRWKRFPLQSLRQEWIQVKGIHSSRVRKTMRVTCFAAALGDDL